MPNTPIYNWRTPADTDPVKDGALAIRNLADDVETTLDSGGYVTSTDIADMVESTDVTNIVSLTQAAYDGLSPKDATTLYVITG